MYYRYAYANSMPMPILVRRARMRKITHLTSGPPRATLTTFGNSGDFKDEAWIAKLQIIHLLVAINEFYPPMRLI